MTLEHGTAVARAVCQLWSGQPCVTLPSEPGLDLLLQAMRVLFGLSASRYDLWVSVPFNPCLTRRDDVEQLLVQKAHWTRVGVAYRLTDTVRICVDEDHSIYLQAEDSTAEPKWACDLLLVNPAFTGSAAPVGLVASRVNQILLLDGGADDADRWLREFTPNGLRNHVRPVPLEVILAGGG